MKHIVKDNKDVIHKGVIYKPDSEGMVDLPDKIENDDIKPVEPEVKEDNKPAKKGK